MNAHPPKAMKMQTLGVKGRKTERQKRYDRCSRNLIADLRTLADIGRWLGTLVRDWCSCSVSTSTVTL